MGRGSDDNSKYKIFFAQIKSKKNEEPHFKLQRKEDANYQLKPGETRSAKDGNYIESVERKMSGVLVGAKTSAYIYENREIHQIDLMLRDHDVQEDYKISCGLASNMGTNLINALLNVQNYGVLSISLYTNKDGFHSMWVENDGTSAGFLIPYEEIKPMVRSYEGKGGQIEYDRTKVYNFFKEKFETVVIPRLKEQLKGRDETPRDVKPKVKTENPQSIDPSKMGKDMSLFPSVEEYAQSELPLEATSSQPAENDLPF